MISGLVRRSAIRIGRSLERVTPPHIAMHAIARIDRHWGEPELRLLPALVQRTPVAIDVGAADGGYTYWLARLADRVHAFEPNPASAAMIRRRVPGAEVHTCALSDHIGELELRIPVVGGIPYTGWGTTHAQNRLASLPPHEIRSIRVECATLDSFGFDNVGLIKIDVEGSELDVLAGAIETIRACRPIILLEAEDRHRPGALQSVHACLSPLDYDGWFLEDARLQRLLRGRNLEGACEVAFPGSHNNFFFIPKECARCDRMVDLRGPVPPTRASADPGERRLSDRPS